ncbi:MAG: precorrin-6A reductase [Bacillota bacterium]|nr:precorrin-6A reductase [Bacillota bacterium]
MTRILVIAGTADSVEFLKRLPASIEAVATTFSQLGADCITPRSGLKIVSGALDQQGFSTLLQENHIDFLVDMSHPFAVEVTQNAQNAAKGTGVSYLRYARRTMEGESVICRRFPDFPSAVDALKEMEGNIFLTIGSKNLHYFQALPDFHERCYMRVLADSRILTELEEMKINPAHVFAMKGVASKELNIALAHECDAKVIVSKDSGISGGIGEKMSAAAELQIPLFLIDKPRDCGVTYDSFEEILNIIGRK